MGKLLAARENRRAGRAMARQALIQAAQEAQPPATLPASSQEAFRQWMADTAWFLARAHCAGRRKASATNALGSEADQDDD